MDSTPGRTGITHIPPLTIWDGTLDKGEGGRGNGGGGGAFDSCSPAAYIEPVVYWTAGEKFIVSRQVG